MGTLALIAVLPLLGFLVNGLVGARLPRRLVALIGCALPAISFAITAALFMRLVSGAPAITETL
jgi:NADH-quinone oxidoreductase subunit L